MRIFLSGLALQHYRGIGNQRQIMAPFLELNFFIGANNSGKSTVLNFIHKYLPLDSENNIKFIKEDSTEVYRGNISGPINAKIGLNIEETIEKIYSRNQDLRRNRNDADPILRKLLGSRSIKNLVWVESADNPGSVYELSSPTDKKIDISLAISNNEWNSLYFYFYQNQYSSSLESMTGDIIRELNGSCQPYIPKCFLIPAIRQIGRSSEPFEDLSGRGLIDRLAEIQSPDHNSLGDRVLFSKINSFLQTILDKPDARIEIPHHRNYILAHMDGKLLPLDSLGTGIHEAIMLASFCTLHENSIMCIEEPEIHLHPLLQRKFVEYIRQNTSNQYFIATHSASFIDTSDAAIFHVTNDGRHTTIRESILRKERTEICRDLGYKASDIIQSNAVIWVEGPSDRIYLNHWLQAEGLGLPKLKEGIDYSIMFYGGRLLSHLSGDPDELEEFINLKSLNQNSVIVMDSDRASGSAGINETKRRIRGEFTKSGGLCWITKGREIENYVEFGRLQSVVKQLYADVYDRPASGGVYDHALHFFRKAPKRRAKSLGKALVPNLLEEKVDKVKVARKVCEACPPDLTVLDLKDRIRELAEFIAKANY
jgi:AAA15 family ATPase/GTPase